MKVCIFTLGCKVNQYESDCLKNRLEQDGHSVFTHLCFADLYIVNTCAVTNEAEKKSRQAIARCRKFNENAKIYVCGCASQNNPNQFELDNVSKICGTKNKDWLLEDDERSVVVTNHNEIYDTLPKYIPTQTRAYIKIQDGCNNFCNYCLIPYLRGRSRSRDFTDIEKEITEVAKLAKEIVITGIDISDYKIDGVKSLKKVVELAKKFPDIRFRFGSLEQGIVESDFIESCSNKNICKHFHLSLQSGCDKTLASMNRKYSTKDYLNTLDVIRQNFADANITTDVIVGFPEESDEDFEQTYKFCEKARFSHIHIFPYSKRKGTAAEKMVQVDGNIVKARVEKLSLLNERLAKEFLESSLNKTFNVLVEEENNGICEGFSDNYIKCYFDGGKIDCFEKVRAVQLFKDGIFCEKI